MSTSNSRPGILQALLSLCIIGLFGATVFLTLSSSFGAIATKSLLLDARKENVQELEARLVAAREESVLKLADLDIAPADLRILADPAQIRERLETACEQALKLERPDESELLSSCAISETPFDNTAALYQARATISGDVGALAARLPSAVRPPVHITSMTVTAGAPDPNISIALELLGARSGETP